MSRVFVIAGLLVCSALAQRPDSSPSFEAESIKPAAPMQQGRMMIGMSGGPGTPDSTHMNFTNVSLADLIQDAYDVKSYQVTGPNWLESARFDISAKLPAGVTEQQSRLMLQNLLAERFKLVLHHASKEASIYGLVVAKNGPKLKESVADAAVPETDSAGPPDAPLRSGKMTLDKDGMPKVPPGAGRGGGIMMMAPGGKMRMVANGVTIASFTETLSMQLDRPVIDMTGLTAKYDIQLDFAPDPAIMQARMAAMGVGPPPGMGPEGRGPGSGGPGGGQQDAGESATVFTALQEQLGLRLDARKGPVDLLMIDSALKTPTEN